MIFSDALSSIHKISLNIGHFRSSFFFKYFKTKKIETKKNFRNDEKLSQKQGFCAASKLNYKKILIIKSVKKKRGRC